ncbi:MAG TPA: outer membrane beta-barrel family protein [Phenylobacterium sp.]|jgi:outer membrane receptor protein involved in Fe transport
MSNRFLRTALVAAAVITAPVVARAQDATGAWHGVLVAGPNVLRVVVRVTAAPDGKLQGEFFSIDQSPKGFPLGDIKVAGGAFSFSLPQIAGSYEGKWDAARNAWVGVWKQGPVSLPLTLAKGEFAPAPAAPPAPAAGPAKPAAKTVEGLTVKGQSQDLRTDIDRRSYDITKDLQAQTGSIADALRNVPSVQVDVDGNVSLRGDPNVTIMVDGKPSSLFKGAARGQVLQNLPANAFERVEVLTNPSAAYRPDGSGGIINLIPKRARQMGRAGSVRATAGPDGKGQVSLNLSSVGKTLTLTGDGTWAHERQQVDVDDRRSSLDPLSGRFLDSVQATAVNQSVDVFIGRAAFDYDPDAKTRISGELRGTGIQADATDQTSFSGQAPGTLAALGFDRSGKVRLTRDNLAANGSWRRKFGTEPDHELVVDATQEHNVDRVDRDEVLTGSGGLASRSERLRNDTDADQSHLKVDYTRPFEDNAKLKAGYELEYDRSIFDNFGLTGPTAAAETPDASLIDRFKFNQAINGVYATYQRPFHDLTVLAGLRLEDTRIDLGDETTGFRGSNDFTRAYPSLHLSWKVDEARQLTASYSERIVRPQPSDYNPFRVYENPFNFRAGNPDLKPQETHSFEVGYQYRKGFTYYLATFYWRQNDKGVTDVVSDLGGGVLLTTKENLSSSRNGGLELVAAGRLGGKFSYQASTDAFWNQIDASGLGFPDTRSDWTLSARGALTYQATPKDQFQLIGQLTGRRLTPQGYHEPLGLLFAGYRHQINKDWALTVSARDLLGSYKDVLVIDTPTLRDRQETRVGLRAVFLSLTYSFGSGPRKDTGIDYGTTGAGAGGTAPR